MWPFKKDSTDKAVKQPVEIVSFIVKTIHKDRLGTVLPAIMSIEKSLIYRSYNTLKEEWKKSANTGAWDAGWFGEIAVSGPKDRLLAKAKTLAKAGCTITLNPGFEGIELPPPDRWWHGRYMLASVPKPPKATEPKAETKPEVKAETKPEVKAEKKTEAAKS